MRDWRLAAIWLSFLFFANPPFATAQSVDFARDVEPIFHERCYVCHGPSMQTNGLRLDRKDAALKGGNSGPAVVPGDSAASKLIERVSSEKEGFRMPPVGPSLSANQIAVLTAWIDAGADWPERAVAPTPSEESQQTHWSFRPVRRPALPEVHNTSWVRNPIDRFVLAKLEAEGVEPSAEAGKITLVRRLYWDLIGLPPTPEEVDAFLTDPRPQAYEELVERLLASPHYGERQAIPWLDAARYADSDGYERDPQRPYAWRWRDWVIEALNGDMPFDRFTVEQIAGDLLPHAAVEQRVATGFLRNGIKNREAGVKNEEKHFEETIDRISTIGTVWLGLTVGCAQCHNHKFDPLSQKEFYQLYAIFNNAVERDIEAPQPGQAGPYLRAYPEYRAKREKILAENGIPELQAAWQRQIRKAMDDPGVHTDWDFNTTEWRAAHDRPDWKMRARVEELTEIERDEIADWFLAHPGPDFEKDEALQKKIKRVREQLDELANDLPEVAQANTIIERDSPEPTHIALRGDWRSPGVEVHGATPAVLNEFQPGEKPLRLAFAQWLVSKDNPLTARVNVNRLWQEVFGRGIVRTADDFGTQGEKPSHPELLDWLASEFVDSGWSRKHMIRLMVTSATYRQASAARPELAERDPENKWLSRQNRLRLPAELVRDNALAVSGLLYPQVGGKSVRPPQPEGVGELMYSKKPWVEDTGPERYRRGLYILFQRTSPYPMLVNFDAPTTLVTAVRRERSNTPLQALNLLNDPVFVEAAQALAVRTLRQAGGFGDRLERMFRLCLSRAPTAAEKDRLTAFFEREREVVRNEAGAAGKIAPFVPAGQDPIDVAAWTGLARGVMNLDEFITRE
jgi:mono/diheme cytochrome c family protein